MSVLYRLTVDGKHLGDIDAKVCDELKYLLNLKGIEFVPIVKNDDSQICLHQMSLDFLSGQQQEMFGDDEVLP